ncbi:zinc-ribbon domain-containing protein [Bifidobacterium xylocopae]|uniref:Zinc-ribbon domain-containing protein n=1 Tax=Bifidobacterium xylocopae TaxID=2493119 RepID=A0A366KCK6_9BIFI|nr:zinc ribbon domain-containing protein [Bifidobacterium xylocopae]RBP99460.1 hypothetical protein CRD59_03570 [Bifidobacterium xylocopae]
MFCTKCGVRNEPDARFCVSCGQPLLPADEVSEVEEEKIQAAGGAPDEAATDGVAGSDGNEPDSEPEPEQGLEPGDEAGAENQPTTVLPQAEQFVTADSEPEADGIHPVQPAEAVPVAHSLHRRTVIIWGVLIGLVVVLAGAYLILKNTVFTPKGQINAYVSAVSSGNFKRANQMVDPGVANESRVLLTNEYAKDEGSRMKDVVVGPLVRKPNGPGYQVRVAYSANGVQQSKQLSVEPSGKQFLIFDSWRIVSPLTTSIKVAAPKTVDNVLVNGIDVTLAKAGTDKQVVSPPADQAPSEDGDRTHYTSMDQYTLPVYPGVAKVELPKSKYVKAEPVKLNDSDKVAYVAPQATDALEQGILEQVQKRIDECTASSELRKTGCNFSNGSFSDGGRPAYTNIRRRVNGSPSLDKLDLGTGEFKTDLIHTGISYQYRFYSDDDWLDDTSSASGYLVGSFSIRNGELTVKIDDSVKSYY